MVGGILDRGIIRIKKYLLRILRNPPMRAFIARLAAASGARAPLTTPVSPLFGEGAAPERRLVEVEAERDALAHEIATLRKRVLELEDLTCRNQPNSLSRR